VVIKAVRFRLLAGRVKSATVLGSDFRRNFTDESASLLDVELYGKAAGRSTSWTRYGRKRAGRVWIEYVSSVGSV
jgi:hypothetical protein